MLFELSNGAHGVFTVSQVSAGRKNRLYFEIDGSNCALAWDQERPNEMWVGHRLHRTITRDFCGRHPVFPRSRHLFNHYHYIFTLDFNFVATYAI